MVELMLAASREPLSIAALAVLGETLPSRRAGPGPVPSRVGRLSCSLLPLQALTCALHLAAYCSPELLLMARDAISGLQLPDTSALSVTCRSEDVCLLPAALCKPVPARLLILKVYFNISAVRSEIMKGGERC